MVRGVYIQRSGSERMALESALIRYLADISPTKKPATQRGETSKAKKLSFGQTPKVRLLVMPEYCPPELLRCELS